MPDEFDRAQQLEQTYRDAAIARVRKAASAPHAAGTEDCQDCGEDIPAERRKAMPGAIRCVQCQTLADRDGAAAR